MECLNQLRGIIFGYEINVFSYHKNLVYAKTLSESQRVICWQLIFEEFGPNIHHIAGVDNIVANTIRRLPSTTSNKYNSCTRNIQCCANKLFEIGKVENNEYSPPLNILIVERKQQIETRNINPKLSTYIWFVTSSAVNDKTAHPRPPL